MEPTLNERIWQWLDGHKQEFFDWWASQTKDASQLELVAFDVDRHVGALMTYMSDGVRKVVNVTPSSLVEGLAALNDELRQRCINAAQDAEDWGLFAKEQGENSERLNSLIEGLIDEFETLQQSLNSAEQSRVEAEGQREAQELLRQSHESQREETFLHSEQLRQELFELNEQERQNTASQSETGRQELFEHNEQQRQSSAETREQEINQTFASNEQERQNTAEQAETDRQELFEHNEQQRQSTAEQAEIVRQQEFDSLQETRLKTAMDEVEAIRSKGDYAQSQGDRAKGYAEHQPKVINGFWWIWSDTENEYVCSHKAVLTPDLFDDEELDEMLNRISSPKIIGSTIVFPAASDARIEGSTLILNR